MPVTVSRELLEEMIKLHEGPDFDHVDHTPLRDECEYCRGAEDHRSDAHALIRKARFEFDAQGRITLDTAAKMYGYGMIPSHIEDNWSAQR